MSFDFKQALLDRGYSEARKNFYGRELVFLDREFTVRHDTVWYGGTDSVIDVSVVLDESTGYVCATFREDRRLEPFKRKEYASAGRRTFNAIQETLRLKGVDL